MLKVSEEVQRALEQGKPVVALESTIITHGMPEPENWQTALSVERTVRDNGAIPATIAIIDGIAHVGLNEAQIKRLAKLDRKKVRKCSKRDLAFAMSKGMHGSTTVAATMHLCQLAGIRVFVTGGVGGVHRGVESTMDISADLTELSRCRNGMCVVCAGIKSILDIPRTLEYLETQSVPVMTLLSDEFPAFFTAHSGCQTPMRVDHPSEVAEMMKVKNTLKVDSAVLLAVPVPADSEADSSRVDVAIEQALKEADQQNIKGSKITPFLLGRVAELTEGHSLDSNIALIRNNARIGAQVARELAANSGQSNRKYLSSKL